MPIDRSQGDERIARIDMILEELRLNTEDLAVARQAKERARKTVEEAREGVAHAIERNPAAHRG